MFYQPYTYLLTWESTGVKYYGVRYAKNCSPADLWVKYFTSSKQVAAYRKVFGDPDIIEIRRTFTNAKDARLWEHKVLSKLGAANRWDYLNLTDAISFPHYKREDHPMFGKQRPDLHKLSATKWYNNGVTNKRCDPKFILQGSFGRSE